MKYKYFSSIILVLTSLFFSTKLSAQYTLDTIEVYNVYCSYSKGNSHYGWGGTYCEFYESQPCNDPIEKYIKAKKEMSKKDDSREVYWMKLLDTNDILLYEGLRYSDCAGGPFICYHLNGQVAIIGEYGGWRKKRNGQYKVNCMISRKKGTWEYYDENGVLLKTEKH